MDSGKVRNTEEFAAKCGMSRPTVSKYFYDLDSVRASTRKRIEDALGRYDFRPNIYAINQNRRLTKNIGIVVPYLADPFLRRLCGRSKIRLSMQVFGQFSSVRTATRLRRSKTSTVCGR